MVGSFATKCDLRCDCPQRQRLRSTAGQSTDYSTQLPLHQSHGGGDHRVFSRHCRLSFFQATPARANSDPRLSAKCASPYRTMQTHIGVSGPPRGQVGPVHHKVPRDNGRRASRCTRCPRDGGLRSPTVLHRSEAKSACACHRREQTVSVCLCLAYGSPVSSTFPIAPCLTRRPRMASGLTSERCRCCRPESCLHRSYQGTGSEEECDQHRTAEHQRRDFENLSAFRSRRIPEGPRKAVLSQCHGPTVG